MKTKRYKRPHKLGRKAQAAETQFNWIFILIVGAVILGFFVFIVIKQKGASEAKFAGKVSQQLDTILVGAKVSSGTFQEIPTPEVTIEFGCDDYFIGPASQRLGNRVVFAPSTVEGSTIQTWTLDWDVPFKVTSFLYITAPTVRYYVIVDQIDDKASTEFYESLPAKLNKQIFTFEDFNNGDIQYENDPYVRFIFYGAEAGSSFNIPPTFEAAKQTTGLIIDPDKKQFQFLESSAGNLVSVGQAFEFHEMPVLYGAIFSDDEENYRCLMKRAYDRVNVISQVYLEKLNALAPEYAGTSCEGYYLDNTNLLGMVEATKEYSIDTHKALGDYVFSLENQNTRLQLQSCPLIY